MRQLVQKIYCPLPRAHCHCPLHTETNGVEYTCILQRLPSVAQSYFSSSSSLFIFLVLAGCRWLVRMNRVTPKSHARCSCATILSRQHWADISGLRNQRWFTG